MTVLRLSHAMLALLATLVDVGLMMECIKRSTATNSMTFVSIVKLQILGHLLSALAATRNGKADDVMYATSFSNHELILEITHTLNDC